MIYTRQSSVANAGKNSSSEQCAMCYAYAMCAGLAIHRVFRGPAVSGTDPLISRPGFGAMIKHCGDHHIRIAATVSP